MLLQPTAVASGLTIQAWIKGDPVRPEVLILRVRRGRKAKPCGVLHAFKLREGILVLSDFQVDLRYRGKGVGSAVIECFLNWARANGFSKVRGNLSTTDAIEGSLTHLIRFYTARGFLITPPWDGLSVHGIELSL